MGMIDRFIGIGPAAAAIGGAASNIAEVFTANATRRMELDEEAHARALAQYGAEFSGPHLGWFDGLVNGLNRLPRPFLALGTMVLFMYSMAEPVGFGIRMQALAQVPEPLWWLLGAIVSFYFGAREAHYLRVRSVVKAGLDQQVEAPLLQTLKTEDDFADNAALRDWAQTMR